MSSVPRRSRTTKYVRSASGSSGLLVPASRPSTLRAPRRSSYRRKRIPTRLMYSRGTFRKNAQIANTLAKFSEKKYSPFADQDEVSPSQTSAGSISRWLGYCFGTTVPTTWTAPVGAWTALNGFTYPQGITNNARDGRYMMLNSSTINCSIEMNSQTRNTPPEQFRFIVFKARRATIPTGVSYNPTDSLFLNTSGDVWGHPSMLGSDFVLQPLNKRDWIILVDKQFTLQAPMGASTESSSFQGKYPSFKRMRLNLNHKIKSAFQDVSDEPTDFDYRYGIVIYSTMVGKDAPAGSWEFNLRGTTTAFDN